MLRLRATSSSRTATSGSSQAIDFTNRKSSMHLLSIYRRAAGVAAAIAFAAATDSSPPAATLPTGVLDEPEPELADVPGQVVELAFALPETARIDREAAEAFLISVNTRGNYVARRFVKGIRSTCQPRAIQQVVLGADSDDYAMWRASHQCSCRLQRREMLTPELRRR